METTPQPVPRRGLTRAALFKGALRFAGGIALFLATVHSLSLAVAWWRGELKPLDAADGLWIVLLPLWIALFLRYYSILRPECGACAPPSADTLRKPDA